MAVLNRKFAIQFPLLIACAYIPFSASAGPLLGADLASFTVLGASMVTNVPTSVIGGSVGVWPSGAIIGFNSSPGVAVSDPQLTGGSVHAGTTIAQAAQGQLTSAIVDLGSLGSGTTLAIADMAGLTLAPGVYTVSAGATNLSGTLILDGQGSANAAWVFQMPSTLITSPNSVVEIINTGSGAGLYWDVGSSATVASNTAFLGNILAHVSITMDSTATDPCGRVLANTGAVSLNMNSLSSNCTGALSGSGGLGGGLDVSTTPGGTTVTTFIHSAKAPEINAASAASALTLLFGGLAVARGRRRSA